LNFGWLFAGFLGVIENVIEVIEI